ncbi:hypothetical protein GCK32_016888 [Trichostrongylus colubriformis]|uniref:EGF-like domain-containing protein n=1 Tax=Trichostrongylus colubriformis TaxID=6319 RepID=A0AAN8FMG2_TRICO
MGKKRIYFHLLIFCAVSTVSCHIYSSGALEYLDNAFATGPFSCAHDGYEKDDGCICKSHFTSSSCTQRVCMNEGIRRSPSGDQGCKCPPGFLGTSCEPVQCIPGDSHSFYEEVEKQSIYVLVTYNTFMNKTIQTNKDDPILAVCQAVQNLTIAKRFWSLNAQIIEIRKTSDVEECVDDAKSWCDPPAVCDPGVLTVSDINAIIDQSEANSQIFQTVRTPEPHSSHIPTSIPN